MDITKLGIIDPRINQSDPRYAIYKGALSISNVASNAISQSTSQHTYNVHVPSLSTFLSKKVIWSSTVDFDVKLTVANNNPVAVNVVPLDFGGNLSVQPYCLNGLTVTQSLTVNDANCTFYSEDMLTELARLIDSKDQKMGSYTPVLLDTLLNYADSDATVSSPLNGYADAIGSNRGRGSFSRYQFLNPATSAPMQDGQTYVAGNATIGGNNVAITLKANQDGVLYFENAVAAADNEYQLSFKLRFFLSEPLMVSPFSYNLEEDDMQNSLFGINNMQLVMNMNSGKRFLRFMPSNLFTNLSCQVNQYSNSKLNTTFLTPNLSIDLPSRNVVNYMEMSRFITNVKNINASTPVELSDPSHSSANIISQSIVFNSIPDLLLIYVKPLDIPNTQSDYYLPINKVSVSFDNFSGLLSSHSPEQLYSMSFSNGVRSVSYDQYMGAFNFSNSTNGKFKRASNGSFLCLKMGKDIALQSGLSPGCQGSYNFQINVSIRNQTGQVIPSANLFVTSIKSGFMETVNGSSRIITAPVTESDVINSKNVNTSYPMKRMIGGGFFSSLSNAISKIKEISPIVKAGLRASGNEKADKVANVMESVGLGRRTGGSRTGGARKAKLSNLY